MDSTAATLARLGAVAAFAGAAFLAVATVLHPGNADPNDAPAAFAEYAADGLWVWSHLGQFIGLALLAAALVALAATLDEGVSAAWGRVVVAGAVASTAVAAALQAVDGVALKNMVDRWAASSGDARRITFEAAFAVRQVEVGLAGYTSFAFGITLVVLAAALARGQRYPRLFALLALVGGAGTVAAGVAQETTGFSPVAMTLTLVFSSVLLLWALFASALMWRLGSRSGGARS